MRHAGARVLFGRVARTPTRRDAMARDIRQLRGLTLVLLLASLLVASSASAASPLKVTWMRGDLVPGTPARYDKVGVVKVGARSARNVLVLAPGTSAAGAYFVPLAKWIVSGPP